MMLGTVRPARHRSADASREDYLRARGAGGALPRNTSASFSSVIKASGYFGPYSTANRLTASRTCARVSEYITSRSAAFTRNWRRFGSSSRMLPSLWNQLRCSRVLG